MKFKKNENVVDKTRVKLWGDTPGRVTRPMGPYRTEVKWPDDRRTQIEKNDDLEVVK